MTTFADGNLRGMAVTVHFTEDDVRARPDDSGGTHFTLTPSAFLASRKAGLNPRNTLDTFTDWGHARCVAAGRRAVREFDAEMENHDLPASLHLVNRQRVMFAAFVARRIAHSLPVGPWCVRAGDGEWHVASMPERAIEVLLPRMLNRRDKRISAVLPPFPGCYRALTRLTARWLAERSPWAIVTSGQIRRGFGEALQACGFRIATIRPTRDGGIEYLRLLKAAVGGNAELSIAPLSATDPRVRTCMRALKRVTHVLGDPCTRAAWRCYLPYWENNIAAMMGVVTEVPEILRRMRQGATVAFEANEWLGATLFEAAREADWPSIVANHNSHPPTRQALANFVIGTLFHHRTGHPLITDAVHWSPQAREWRRTNRSDGKIRASHFRADYPPLQPAAGERAFRILHAGNYRNWREFFPWVGETADEFVRGLAHLAVIAARVPGIELIFRIRPKDEVNADVVRESIPLASNVRIASTSQRFLEQLAESDLLISHFSTTVEQALQMGIPRPSVGQRASIPTVSSSNIAANRHRTVGGLRGRRPRQSAGDARRYS